MHASAPPRLPVSRVTGSGPFWYYDHYRMSLPQRHRYPRSRFAMVRAQLAESALLPAGQALPAEPADWTLLESVHTSGYLRALREGSLSAQAVREIGLPFSPELVERARAAVGATVQAAGRALETGATGVIGGGTHHAFAGHGSGYCLFNDIAVAIRHVQRRHGLERIAIVDLDVHQGNGNADIFRDDPGVFTFSAHGEHNWPYRKSVSDLDLGLPDGTGDEAYLATVEPVLRELFERFTPQLVFYQAGVDPLHTDRLGRLSLTLDGLAKRDALVFDVCRAAGCPVVVTMGGGYGVPIETSVAAHVNTVRALLGPERPAAAP